VLRKKTLKNLSPIKVFLEIRGVHQKPKRVDTKRKELAKEYQKTLSTRRGRMVQELNESL